MTATLVALPDMADAPASPAPVAAEHAEMWALIQRAKAGDLDAFGEVYEHYVDTVFRFLYFRCGSHPLSEDLCSETFLRAIRRLGSYTYEGRDFGAFLVTIARNLLADHFKSSRHKLEITIGDVLDANGDRADRDRAVDPEANALDYMSNRTLAAAVMQLADDQREVIILRFFRGLSVGETAEVMGKNVGAIKASQYRAVRALAYLLPDGFDPQGRMPETMAAGYTGQRLAQRRVR